MRCASPEDRHAETSRQSPIIRSLTIGVPVMPRRRKPVDTTGVHYGLDERTPPLDWSAFVGNDRPVLVEVGPRKGVFLAHAGGMLPGTDFAGVERAKKYAVASAERVVKACLENVRLVSGDGQEFLERFVPEGSVEVLHVYFPDPWWKARHRKRRVVNERFLDRASKVVRAGGGASGPDGR